MDYFENKYINLDVQDEDAICDVQLRLLRKHIHYLATTSPYYRELFRLNSISCEVINSLNDITYIPFTKKADLASRNEDFLAVPKSDIVDVCLTSGSSGSTPTSIMLTRHDLSRLAYNEMTAFQRVGITESDIILNCAALDRCFMGGLAYFLGGTQIGATTLRGRRRQSGSTMGFIERSTGEYCCWRSIVDVESCAIRPSTSVKILPVPV